MAETTGLGQKRSSLTNLPSLDKPYPCKSLAVCVSLSTP
jgi:hypothetical protein